MLKYVCLLCLPLTLGCSSADSGPKTVNASGVVTLDGAPAALAQVIFIDESSEYPASGMTDESGNFSLSVNNKKGAVPGSYKVQVSKTQLGAADGGVGDGANVSISHGLPKKYASYITSGLTVTVPESGTSDIKLELSSK